MAKYKKKPVEIEAVPYERGLEDGFKCGIALYGQDCGAVNKRCEEDFNTCSFTIPYINTLEGKMTISDTDMIITGVEGERYPCKLDIFNKTYDRVE